MITEGENLRGAASSHDATNFPCRKRGSVGGSIGRVADGAATSAETGDGPYRGFDAKRFRHVVRYDDRIRKRNGSRVDGKTCLPAKPSEHVHVRSYSPPNWFTVDGVRRKRRQIEGKGLPSFKGWRFLTLTLDPKLFENDPLKGYHAGKDRVRRFLDACRKAGIWSQHARWCWKLEFMKNGWPHWHVWVDQGFIREDLHSQITPIWGLGRAECKQVHSDDMAYEFKYAFKPAQREDTDAVEDEESEMISWMVPSWFLDFVASKSVDVRWKDQDGVAHKQLAEKPETFARVRFWQTSTGFYTGKPSVSSPSEGPFSCMLPRPVREVAVDRASTVQVVARTGRGSYVASAVIVLSCLTGHFWDRVGFDAYHGQAVGLAVNSFVLPTDTLTQYTSLWQQPQLKSILPMNRLRLGRAVKLQQAMETLRTC